MYIPQNKANICNIVRVFLFQPRLEIFGVNTTDCVIQSWPRGVQGSRPTQKKNKPRVDYEPRSAYGRAVNKPLAELEPRTPAAARLINRRQSKKPLSQWLRGLTSTLKLKFSAFFDRNDSSITIRRTGAGVKEAGQRILKFAAIRYSIRQQRVQTVYADYRGFSLNKHLT